jgi:hypothetical protein
MRKYCLPKIRKPGEASLSVKKPHNFNTPFNSKLKQFKLRRCKYNGPMDDPNKTDTNYLCRGMLTEESFNNLKKEQDKILIEGQKYLVKIYESNFDTLIDRIKTESPKSNEISIIKNFFKKKDLPSVSVDENGKEIVQKPLETIPNEIRYNNTFKKKIWI